MAFANEIRSFEYGIVRRMRASMEQARIQYHKNREVSRTFDELNSLTDRDLSDLGIARENIRQIAKSAAYSK